MQQRPHRAHNGHLNSPFQPKTFFYPRYRPDGLDRERLNGLQSSLERMKGEQWASIQDLTIAASPQLAKLEDNLAFTVGFKLKGGIRRNFVRPGVFFWTRNPELPYRVWATVATEFETILYPKTEEEARTMLFDVTRSFELPASRLGKGHHALEAKVRAKWGKHVFTERGEATAKTPVVKVDVR